MRYIRPHLSPELRAQITPRHSRDRRFVVAGVFFLVLSMILTLNLIWPKNKPQVNISKQEGEKQVLGTTSTSEPQEEFTPLETDTKNISVSGDESLTGFTSYTVKNGDTLFNISQQYNIKWDLIAQVNGLSEPYILHPGQTLKIPQATTSKLPGKIYTVQTGDTLASIARKYNITVTDIIAVNPNLQQSDLIVPGQVIKLP